jgi:hypothetical protein
VFFDRAAGRLCAIHRAAGHGALPSACRHFPRVILAEDDGLSVAFSHVCPTAAAMLLDGDDDDVAIVEERGGADLVWGRPSFGCAQDKSGLPLPAGLKPCATPDSSPELEPEAEGFDARGTVPPFVRPGVVFDRASCRAWESFLVEACNRAETPEVVLARMARATEALRAWTPAKGEMLSYASDVLERALGEGDGRQDALPWHDAARLHALVAACVRPGLPPPPEPDAVESPGAGRAWVDGARVARRYLAARAFGAWSAYLGDGVRTQVAVLAATLAVLRIVAGRAAGESETLSSEAWRRVLGCADRLVVHQLDEAELCRRLGIVESMPAAAFMQMLGVGGA